ncbi:MAG: hypothetical protein ABIJ57_03705 [Pseudomonadota bacterium]
MSNKTKLMKSVHRKIRKGGNEIGRKLAKDLLALPFSKWKRPAIYPKCCICEKGLIDGGFFVADPVLERHYCEDHIEEMLANHTGKVRVHFNI